MVDYFEADGTSTPDHVLIGGNTINVTLANGATICTLRFLYLGGSTNLTWVDDGISCEYANQDGDALPETPFAVKSTSIR